MGLHLNKKLGWALTDLQHDERGALTDPRVPRSSHLDVPPDELGPQYLMYLESLKDARSPESGDWFDIALEMAMVEEVAKQERRLHWPITRESEAGRRDVLLIQPVGYPQWSRHNDPIDAAEEYALTGSVEPRVVPMTHGIWPFEGLYMDSRDGRNLDTTAKRLIDRLASRWGEEDGQKYREAADHLARTSGFDDADQALEYAVPRVPGEILRVCSWLNLFNGPDVWLQLRPVLYVYWS